MLVLRIDEHLIWKSERLNRRVRKWELAEYMGVTKATVSNWCDPKGINSISAETLIQLCLFFDLPASRAHELYYLIDDTKEVKVGA